MIADDHTTRLPTAGPPDAPAPPRRSFLRFPRPTKFNRGLWGEAWRWAIVVAVTGAVGIALLAVSLVAAIYLQARASQSRQVDAIVVLGTAQYNGRPSPALRARLDETLAAYESGLAPYVVVTGGKQAGDQFTEAEASRTYLVEHGVPESAILMETRGRNSWQSLQGAAEALRAVGARRVLIVSDGFHLFRLKVMARELGLDPAAARAATGGPIRQNSVSEFNYIVREAAATAIFLAGRTL